MSIRYPDSIVFSNDGSMVAPPKIRKTFIMLGKEGKPIQHECLYEGTATFELLKNNVVAAQITVDENNPRIEGVELVKYKDIENTPVGVLTDHLVPREQIMTSNKLWRYINLFKFEDLIVNRRLYYSRLDCFTDSFEGCAPESCVNAIWNDPEKNEEQKRQAAKLFNRRMDNNRKVSFASCWHINENLNHEMWNEYGENSVESLAIQTTVSKIDKVAKKSLIPILNEPVRYFNEPYFNQNAYWFPTLFKRHSFSHEQEFRSILFAYGPEIKGMPVKIDPEDFITKIHVHRNASKDFFKKIREFVKSQGLRIPISQKG